MTDRTPTTAAGRTHLQWLLAGDDVFPEDALNAVLAIEDEAEARASLDVKRLARGYTVLVSSIPALYRAWRDAPNQTARSLNRVLLDAAIEWVMLYQQDVLGREADNFDEYGPSAALKEPTP